MEEGNLELRTRYWKVKPGEYPEGRVCWECGAEFEKDKVEQHADHMARHQPTIGQWTEAYKMMEAAKEKKGKSTG